MDFFIRTTVTRIRFHKSTLIIHPSSIYDMKNDPWLTIKNQYCNSMMMMMMTVGYQVKTEFTKY